MNLATLYMAGAPLFYPTYMTHKQKLTADYQYSFIVTGGYAGCGKELSKILYSKNGTVYVAGRSQEKADRAIDEIKKAVPSSDGRLEFLKVDLADLTNIKASADDFLKREQRLDVLTNNAGVMTPPVGSKSAQDHELQMGTNCLGHFLFTQCLTPLLQKTAASSSPGSVRVTWAASMSTMFSPKQGVAWDEKTVGPKVHNSPGLDYAQTKAGNVIMAKEYQAQVGKDGIVSNSWNPGTYQNSGFVLLGLTLLTPLLSFDSADASNF